MVEPRLEPTLGLIIAHIVCRPPSPSRTGFTKEIGLIGNAIIIHSEHTTQFSPASAVPCAFSSDTRHVEPPFGASILPQSKMCNSVDEKSLTLSTSHAANQINPRQA